jgi:hypothetical protein
VESVRQNLLRDALPQLLHAPHGEALGHECSVISHHRTVARWM